MEIAHGQLSSGHFRCLPQGPVKDVGYMVIVSSGDVFSAYEAVASSLAPPVGNLALGQSLLKFQTVNAANVTLVPSNVQVNSTHTIPGARCLQLEASEYSMSVNFSYCVGSLDDGVRGCLAPASASCVTDVFGTVIGLCVAARMRRPLVVPPLVALSTAPWTDVSARHARICSATNSSVCVCLNQSSAVDNPMITRAYKVPLSGFSVMPPSDPKGAYSLTITNGQKIPLSTYPGWAAPEISLSGRVISHAGNNGGKASIILAMNGGGMMVGEIRILTPDSFVLFMCSAPGYLLRNLHNVAVPPRWAHCNSTYNCIEVAVSRPPSSAAVMPLALQGEWVGKVAFRLTSEPSGRIGLKCTAETAHVGITVRINGTHTTSSIASARDPVTNISLPFGADKDSTSRVIAAMALSPSSWALFFVGGEIGDTDCQRYELTSPGVLRASMCITTVPGNSIAPDDFCPDSPTPTCDSLGPAHMGLSACLIIDMTRSQIASTEAKLVPQLLTPASSVALASYWLIIVLILFFIVAIFKRRSRKRKLAEHPEWFVPTGLIRQIHCNHSLFGIVAREGDCFSPSARVLSFSISCFAELVTCALTPYVNPDRLDSASGSTSAMLSGFFFSFAFGAVISLLLGAEYVQSAFVRAGRDGTSHSVRVSWISSAAIAAAEVLIIALAFALPALTTVRVPFRATTVLSMWAVSVLISVSVIQPLFIVAKRFAWAEREVHAVRGGSKVAPSAMDSEPAEGGETAVQLEDAPAAASAADEAAVKAP
eukprot:c16042_g1_i2.p1 GENE.c16042_g1_i2~~c16042_g1_i2.p1  ORF type:complete len:834 (+),score=105.96 c16042_g1_i2:204-2504(+)